jgi:hypothetical protein
MPSGPDAAETHTHKAAIRMLGAGWAKIANDCLERYWNESCAIRDASAVVVPWAGDM